jgi:hypothetical protein
MGATTLSIMALSIMTLSITTNSITTLSITKNATLSILAPDTAKLGVVMLSVIFVECRK